MSECGFFLHDNNNNNKWKNDYRNNTSNAHELIIVCSSAGISSLAEKHISAFNFMFAQW